MSLFFRQFQTEIRRLFARPRARLGLAVVFATQLLLAGLFQLHPVQATLWREARRLHLQVAAVFSDVTTVSYLTINLTQTVGMFFVVLLGADVLGQDAEEGTLRMILNRPASRHRVFIQKACAAILYALVVGLVIGVGAFAIGMLVGKPGSLFVISLEDSVLGQFQREEGVRRIALAITLLPLSLITPALLAFALSCFPIKPASACAGALTWLIAEQALRRIPQCSFLRDDLLVSRLGTWINAYNQIIPETLMLQHAAQLATLNAALLLIGWLAIRRRDFK